MVRPTIIIINNRSYYTFSGVNIVPPLLKLMDQTFSCQQYFGKDLHLSCQEVSGGCGRPAGLLRLSVSSSMRSSVFLEAPRDSGQTMIRVAGSGTRHKGADGRKNIFVNAAQFQ